MRITPFVGQSTLCSTLPNLSNYTAQPASPSTIRSVLLRPKERFCFYGRSASSQRPCYRQDDANLTLHPDSLVLLRFMATCGLWRASSSFAR
jgi:hypothetical protein